ncbi:MAG TPA: tetratricopeptide repeat protein, partial [Acidobacteriota bacterium]|nr:tetratricopeptide repeat protein [Acidobacteriota bacterium]
MKIHLWPIIMILAIAFSFARADESPLDKADKLAGAKKYEEALTLLREYDRSHPEDVEVHNRIQKILKRQNKQQEAIAEYRERFEKDPTPFNGYLYARLLESPIERETKFREIVAKDGKFVWGYVGLATALLDQDRLQDGIDAADEGIKNVSEPAELDYIKARIYRRMQDYPAAAAAMREYYRLKPNDETRD